MFPEIDPKIPIFLRKITGLVQNLPKATINPSTKKKLLRAKCHVRLAWLIKRLLCRLVTGMGSSVTLFKALNYAVLKYCLVASSARLLHCKQFLRMIHVTPNY